MAFVLTHKHLFLPFPWIQLFTYVQLFLDSNFFESVPILFHIQINVLLQLLLNLQVCDSVEKTISDYD